MVVPSRQTCNVMIFLKEYLTENRTVGVRPTRVTTLGAQFIASTAGAENLGYATECNFWFLWFMAVRFSDTESHGRRCDVVKQTGAERQKVLCHNKRNVTFCIRDARTETDCYAIARACAVQHAQSAGRITQADVTSATGAVVFQTSANYVNKQAPPTVDWQPITILYRIASVSSTRFVVRRRCHAQLSTNNDKAGDVYDRSDE